MRHVVFAACALGILIAAFGCKKAPAPPPAPPEENTTVQSPCDVVDNATAARKGRFERAGEEAGKMLKERAHEAGEIAEKGAIEAGKAADKAAKTTGKALIKTGEWLVDDNTTTKK